MLIRCGILVFLLTMWTNSASAQSCGVEPVKPVPAVGCKDMTPSCVCESSSKCQWDWVCVRDTPIASDDGSAALGHAVGHAVGQSIMNARINRGVKKYCKQHPGEPYHWTVPDGTVVRRGT